MMDKMHHFHGKCGCLHSGSNATLKKFTNQSEAVQPKNSNSFPQALQQNASDIKCLKTFLESNESIHVVKLNTLRKRILSTLTGIQNLLKDAPLPDGIEDLKRRKQRAAEFSARFCRHYLYQLQRQVNNATRAWEKVSKTQKSSSYFLLYQKVITAHKNACLALKAYLQHMPSSIVGGVPDKLEEILQIIVDLCSLCSKLEMNEGDPSCNSKKVKKQCEKLLFQIRQQGGNVSEESCCSTFPERAHNKGKKLHKNNSASRLSMYSKQSTEKLRENLSKTVSKIYAVPKKKHGRSHSIKHGVKEVHIRPIVKTGESEEPTVHHDQKQHEKEGSEIGEVCTVDDIKTLMEHFLTEKDSEVFDLPNKNITTKRNSKHSARGHKENPQHCHANTFQKLETEIKNLKGQAKVLKEKGHPNYSIYIEMLEIMSRQLVNIKSQKGTVGDSSNAQQMPNEKSDTELHENVKLICITHVEENKVTNSKTSHEPSSPRVISIRKDEETNTEILKLENKPRILLYDTYRRVHNQGEGQIKKPFNNNRMDEVQRSSVWEPKCVGKLCELKNEKILSLDIYLPVSPKSSIQDQSSHEADDYKLTEKSVSPVPLCISEEEMAAALMYKENFQNYMNTRSIYKDTWHTVARLADQIVNSILEEIVWHDTGIQKITYGLLQLEFQ